MDPPLPHAPVVELLECAVHLALDVPPLKNPFSIYINPNSANSHSANPKLPPFKSPFSGAFFDTKMDPPLPHAPVVELLECAVHLALDVPPLKNPFSTYINPNSANSHSANPKLPPFESPFSGASFDTKMDPPLPHAPVVELLECAVHLALDISHLKNPPSS
jgi:hypothetical protein